MTASRARSFGAVAAAYAQHRPEYPDAAVQWALQPVADRGALDLLDLGAGTGKLTGSLLDRGRVRAVEPDPAMLRELRGRFPAVDALEGSAEAIPLPDASVDAVLVGQAWHWFDPEGGHAEIARVLRPGGVLAVLWNGDDASVDWVATMNEIIGRTRAGAAPRVPQEGALPAHRSFAAGEYGRFPNPVATTVDGLVATLGTHSWALVGDPAERDAAFDRLRAYLATRPETSAGGFVLPLVTEAIRALRR